MVRGAASSLYGTDALAGVIHLVTRARPGRPPRLRAEAEGGELRLAPRARAATSGTDGRASTGTPGCMRLHTDNEEPNSAFAQTAGAARLGARLGERVDAAPRRARGDERDGHARARRLRPARPRRHLRARRPRRAAHLRHAARARRPTSCAPACAADAPALAEPARLRAPTCRVRRPGGAVPASPTSRTRSASRTTPTALSLGYQAEAQAGRAPPADRRRATWSARRATLGSRADEELLSPDAHERGRLPAGPGGAGASASS